MKFISDIFTFALFGILLGIILSYFSLGYEHSPIPIWIWVITILIAFQAWKKSSNNSKAKDLAMCAVMCPVAASLGTAGLIALRPGLLQDPQGIITILNITLFAFMVGTTIASYQCTKAATRRRETDMNC